MNYERTRNRIVAPRKRLGAPLSECATPSPILASRDSPHHFDGRDQEFFPSGIRASVSALVLGREKPSSEDSAAQEQEIHVRSELLGALHTDDRGSRRAVRSFERSCLSQVRPTEGASEALLWLRQNPQGSSRVLPQTDG